MSQQWPGIEALPRHLPGIEAPTRPRHLPGIEASSLPSLRHTEVGIPTSLSHRGRNSDFAFLPEKPITGPAPKVRERCRPRSIADIVFFSPFTRPTSILAWAHSILAWAQDCPTQSWRGHRIAPLNPGVGAGLPHSILVWAQDCPGVSQKTLEAQCSTTPPDSPPGLRGKHRQCVGAHRCTPGLAARIARKTPSAHCCVAGRSRKTPAGQCCTALRSRARRPASRLQIWQVTQRKWGRSSCFLRQSTAASSPLTPWCPWCHVRASSSGRQNRAKPWL